MYFSNSLKINKTLLLQHPGVHCRVQRKNNSKASFHLCVLDG